MSENCAFPEYRYLVSQEDIDDLRRREDEAKKSKTDDIIGFGSVPASFKKLSSDDIFAESRNSVLEDNVPVRLNSAEAASTKLQIILLNDKKDKLISVMGILILDY